MTGEFYELGILRIVPMPRQDGHYIICRRFRWLSSLYPCYWRVSSPSALVPSVILPVYLFLNVCL